MDTTPEFIAQNFIKTIKKRLLISLVVIILGFLYLIYNVGQPGSVSIITVIFAFFLAAATIVFNLLAAEMDREKLYHVLFEEKDADKAREVFQYVIANFPSALRQSFISTDFYYATALSMLLTGSSNHDIQNYLEGVMGGRLHDNGRFKLLYLAHLSALTHDKQFVDAITPLGKVNGLNKQIIDYVDAVNASLNHDEKALQDAVSLIEEMNVYPLITEFAQTLKA